MEGKRAAAGLSRVPVLLQQFAFDRGMQHG